MSENALTTATKSFPKPGDGLTKFFSYAIPLTIVAAVVYFFGSTMGDFVVNAVDNMLHLAIVIGAMFAMGWVLFDKQPRTLVFYMYRSFMRALTSWFVDCDPIGVLKTYQERLSGKLADMETALNSLRGMRQKVAAKLKATDSELDNELRKCDLAKKAGDTRTLALEGKQVNRLQASKERYTLSMGNLDMMIAVMSRYFGLCQDTITDMGREIKWREDEREEGKQIGLSSEAPRPFCKVFLSKRCGTKQPKNCSPTIWLLSVKSKASLT
jgi:hypothetical protein